MVEPYLVPAGPAQSAFTEKKSRFLTDLFVVETEAEARARLEEVRRREHDARHHCWCYRLRAGGLERYSDDGEPQGTAGQPMLAVFQRAQVQNVLCVVTRYFGGVLLGAGGLTRAYGRGARDGLEAAGVAVVRPWTRLEVPCPYRLYERARLLAEACGGVVTGADYGADVTLSAMFPRTAVADFQTQLRELSSGAFAAADRGEELRAFPVDRQEARRIAEKIAAGEKDF